MKATGNESLFVIKYQDNIDFRHLFHTLKAKFGIDNMTVQTGGTLNSVLIRENLIDYLSVVVAPALIGGKYTPSLVDGKSIEKRDELNQIKTMKLLAAAILEDSYLHLKYEIKNDGV